MTFVSLTDVHQGQHHEDERLQRDDHDVEDGPGRACKNVRDEQTDTAQRGQASRTQQGNQHEHQLAGVHVAHSRMP